MLLALSNLYTGIFVIKRQMRCNSNRKNKKSLPFMSSVICFVHLFTILMTVLTKYIFELNFLLKIRRCSIDRNVYGATVRLKCQCFRCFYLSHFVCNKEMILYLIKSCIIRFSFDIQNKICDVLVYVKISWNMMISRK